MFSAITVVGIVGTILIGVFLYIKTTSKKEVPVKAAYTLNQRDSVLSKEWSYFTVQKITQVSHNVKSFRILTESPDVSLGISLGHHIRVGYIDESEGKVISKPYTPYSPLDQTGYFDVIVKVYPNGRVSGYLHSLKEGDKVLISGPTGINKYVPGAIAHWGMIAGGTGITPMLQYINYLLEHDTDSTITLIYCNSTCQDILLKQELNNMAVKYKYRFNLIHCVSKLVFEDDQHWIMEEGRVCADHLKKYLPSPQEERIRIMYCGPPTFDKHIREILPEIGYQKPIHY
eukprot:TRINITY_DN10661_c0_g1_i1.p1 TRINITY_DN10661_c0_g1~~TRINITY_DN10661_c0_g1_i1.p1  ORF type:complete len:287 (+),score=51.68 TRINITY_DN10661_c0_g1_i1:49-909(+)